MDVPTIALGAVALACVQYVAAERFGRRAWGRVPLMLKVEAGPYRESRVQVEHGERAPGAIRRAAFLCIVFGQMFMPGALAVVMGIFAFGRYGGLGAVLGLPGLVAAGSLWTTGYMLLFRAARRRAWARFAASWSIALNVGILLAYASYVVHGMPAFGDNHPLRTYVEREVMLGTIVYAFLSLAQAAHLRRALQAEDRQPAARRRAHASLPQWLLHLLARKRAKVREPSFTAGSR